MAGQTRPSPILSRPDPETPVSEATSAELLIEVRDRIHGRLDGGEEVSPEWTADLRRARDQIEDAISLHNRAVYRERGVFAITDAERLPSESLMPLVLPLAVVAFSRADAATYIRRVEPREPVTVITRREDALGKRFRDAVYIAGWDRDLSSSASDAIRGVVDAAVRTGSEPSS